jgi:flagellar motility protein MotE (MotC chaperone)
MRNAPIASPRRAALDERERDLAMREQLIGVTEKRVEERLVELKALEERLNAMLAKRDEAEETQFVTLVRMYENMKPPEAARIFNRLDRQVLLTVASRMKPAKIGPVMAAMEPARAQDLTVMLALRLNVARKPTAETPGVQARPAPPNG